MSLLSRSIVAATAGMALMGLAACGKDTAGLANLDPCKVISPQQLSADGLPAQGTPNNSSRDVPGCTFKTRDTQVAFFKSQTQTVDTYEQQQPTNNYTKISINGRTAARAEAADGGSASGECDILIDAGGGLVLVNVIHPGPDNQACAQALNYAQQISPALPK